MLCAEVARTPEQMRAGLMGRGIVPPGTGMVFSGKLLHIWTAGMRVPLDLVWFDTTGRIVKIDANVPPCLSFPCVHYTGAANVLEIGAEEAARHGLAVGQVLNFGNCQEVAA